MTINILVADDETPARDRIAACLLPHADCKVVGVARNGHETVTAIADLLPSAVFLDVHMPQMNGFEVIDSVGADRMPPTVLITAHNQYALRAYDCAILDYLLKPFTDERFDTALDRLRQRLGLAQDIAGHGGAASAPIAGEAPAVSGQAGGSRVLERIAVECGRRTYTISVEDIEYVSASNVYVELHVGERTFVVRQRMLDLEQRLDPRRFLRVHRSTIVQLDRVQRLTRLEGADYLLTLVTGAEVAVSRSRVGLLKQWMGGTADQTD